MTDDDATRDDADPARSDRLDRFQTPGPRNSLWSWPDAKSPLAVV
ncbi:acetyltransferase, partial [Halorubrum sp. E3]